MSDNETRPDTADANAAAGKGPTADAGPTDTVSSFAAEELVVDDLIDADAPVEPTEPSAAAELAAMAAEVARLTEENARLKDQALRSLAEAENTRRRAQKEKEDTAKFAVSGFAKDLLNVADNLTRALDSVPTDSADPAMTRALRDGVSAVDREMMSVFDRHGLTKIVPAGERFDPNYHQAMFEVPESGQLPGTVVQVIQPGYVLHGRLLRPAMVGVAKGEPPPKVDTEA